jgi:hypothetical protein
MSRHRLATRRSILKGFAAAVSILFAPSRRAAAESFLDRGIGGTGAVSAPKEPEGDRGIGGTGVIGTIQRFGSIIVNDLRISYPQDVSVSLDGEPAKVSDLKIGQVVRVVADRRAAGLSTRKIEVASEVVGRIDGVSLGRFNVLGQTVSLAGLSGADSQWRIGDHVAVSGLRRLDGTIMASFIEKRPGEATRVAGPVVEAPDGSVTLGRLRLSGVDRDLIGRRALLEGRLAAGVFEVSSGRSEQALLGPNVKALSVEAYVERSGGGLRLGSGLEVAGGKASNLPHGEAVRAVITTSVGGNGRLQVESIHPDPRGGGQEPSNGGKPGGSNDKGGMTQPGRLGGRGKAEGPGHSSGPGGFGAPSGQGARPGQGGAAVPEPSGFLNPGGLNSPPGAPAGPGGPAGAGPSGFVNPGGLNAPGGPGGPMGGPGGPMGLGGFGGPPGR